MTPLELRSFMDRGRSILVGTADAEGQPACCRAVAISCNEDLSRLTVYLPVDIAQQTIANIATTRRVAVTASEPLDHSTVQFKGWSEGVRIATEHERELVTRRMDEFCETLAAIGVPRAVSARITRWPAFAVEVGIEAIFDQTPGPRAGVPLE